ncbi:MAG: insulinase family protein [Muribaculum sp.]|nr:insulinase family protein [Muribaculum sp.]
MMRKIFSLAMFLIAGIFALSAQMPQELPLAPQVKSGVLPNGLHYYILHNEEPKNRANFYIAQKVGSTLETPEQLGLAHFLEHMAFNGTTTYPGKSMLNYLQSKGIRFGADINAYTAFDETVYNINNVPTSDRPLMDSVLLVLRDWSGSILLEEDEIDAERGVIREEWRSRNSAQIRMYESILPKIYQEYQYQQMPIGKMEIVMNFKPEVLRAYYKKWYRPDQQGIVIVGDFDADEMETKVKQLFASIPMPENAAERTYPTVSDNEKPIFVSFQDPEQQYTMVQLAFKYDKTPFEMRNTDAAYVGDVLIPNLIATMINNRLSEYAQKPECKYSFAGVRFSDFLVSKTKGAFNVTVIAKDDVKAAYADAIAIVARACKTGFSDSEMVRARDEILAGYQKSLNEKDKTDNDDRAQELIRHFIDNEPAPGIEMENSFANAVLTSIPVSAINEVCAQLLTPTNQVIIAAAPEGVQLMTEEEGTSILNNALNAEYEAYVDEVITEPLIANLPAKGSVVKTEKNSALGTTTYYLSNGAKVVVKPTDFSSDEIVFEGYSEGGKRSFATSQAADVDLIGDVFETSKMGPFDISTLQKYLAGKKVSLGFSIGNYTNVFNGKSTVKDFQTLMELIYTSFTSMSKDPQAYEARISQAKSVMANYEKDPSFVFQQQIQKSMSGGNPMQMPTTIATIDKANYENMFNMYQNAVSNAANFTFLFVGNVDENTLLPLIEQYIASLPSTGKTSKVKDVTSMKIVQGQVTNEFNQKMQTPAVMVYDLISGTNVKYNTQNSIYVDLIGDILDIIYTETLREEEGGTYGASCGSAINPNTGQWSVIYTFQTNPEQQKSLRERAYKELLELLNNGAKEDHFNKVKEAAIKQLDIRERNNGWWTNQIFACERGFNTVTDYRQTLEGITLNGLNKFMKSLYNGKNRIEVVMNGSPEF